MYMLHAERVELFSKWNINDKAERNLGLGSMEFALAKVRGGGGGVPGISGLLGIKVTVRQSYLETLFVTLVV